MPTKAAKARMPVFRDRFNMLRGNKTQKEFADELGMSRATVAFYCAGDRVPDALTLRDIAEKCNVSVDWLLGLTDAKSRNITLQNACNYTGLTENAARILHFYNERENDALKTGDISGEVKTLSAFIETATLFRFNEQLYGCIEEAKKLISKTQHFIDTPSLHSEDEYYTEKTSDLLAFYRLYRFQAIEIVQDFVDDQIDAYDKRYNELFDQLFNIFHSDHNEKCPVNDGGGSDAKQ